MQCSVNNKNSRKSFEYHHLISVSSRMKATLHGTNAGRWYFIEKMARRLRKVENLAQTRSSCNSVALTTDTPNTQTQLTRKCQKLMSNWKRAKMLFESDIGRTNAVKWNGRAELPQAHTQIIRILSINCSLFRAPGLKYHLCVVCFEFSILCDISLMEIAMWCIFPANRIAFEFVGWKIGWNCGKYNLMLAYRSGSDMFHCKVCTFRTGTRDAPDRRWQTHSY